MWLMKLATVTVLVYPADLNAMLLLMISTKHTWKQYLGRVNSLSLILVTNTDKKRQYKITTYKVSSV